MDRRNDLDCKPTTSSNVSWAEARKDDARHRCPDYHHPLEKLNHAKFVPILVLVRRWEGDVLGAGCLLDPAYLHIGRGPPMIGRSMRPWQSNYWSRTNTLTLFEKHAAWLLQFTMIMLTRHHNNHYGFKLDTHWFSCGIIQFDKVDIVEARSKSKTYSAPQMQNSKRYPIFSYH